jgi:hypothetical protein
MLEVLALVAMLAVLALVSM